MPPKGSTKRARSRSPSTSKPKASTSTSASTSTPTKRKTRARASTAEPESKSTSKETRASADNEPSARGRKRTRVGGTPGPGGSRPIINLSNITKDLKKDYIPKLGMNDLPKPLRPIHESDFKSFTTAQVTNPHSAFSGNANANGNGEGEILNRELFVFGNGDMGQHGLGTEVIDEIKRPRQHTWVKEANLNDKLGKGGLEMIAAGGMHTLAIDSQGRVLSWGINDNAALGRRTDREHPEIAAEVYETEPMQVEGFAPTGQGVLGGPKPSGGKTGEVDKFRATRIAAGDSVSVAVSEEGEVRVWGSFRSNEGLLGFDGREGSDRTQYLPVALPALQKHSIVQVSCGSDHVLALTTDGQVLTWGNGQQCQLGRRIIERRKINGLTPEKLNLKNIVLVGSGGFHSFAVDKNGKVFAWGLNSYDQTGLELDDDVIPFPTEVKSLHPSKHDGSKVIQIQVGGDHSMFLFDNGKVFVVGRCDGWELGLPNDHEEKKRIDENRRLWKENREKELVVEMKEYQERMELKRKEMEEKRKENGQQDGGGGFGMVISEGDVPPKLGAPPQEIVSKPVHLPFPKPQIDSKDCKTDDGESKIISLAAGTRHTLAIAQDGTLYSWGFGLSSQLGQGDEESIETPTMVRSKQFNGFRAVAATAGGQHSAVLAVKDPEYEG